MVRVRRLVLLGWVLSAAPALAAARPADATPSQPGTGRMWVYFSDKGLESAEEVVVALAEVAATYDAHAVERRVLRRTAPGLFDVRDVPVAPRYVDAVTSAGATVHVTSNWLNAISVRATPEQLATIAALPFVDRVEPVRVGRRVDPVLRRVPVGDPRSREQQRGSFYGYAEDQNAQIGVPTMHGLGYTGAGLIVGVLDTGFERSHVAFNTPGHEIDVLAEYDFLDDDGDTSIEPGDYGDQHTHGTLILSTLAGYVPNEFVGTLFDATFVLAKTEDVTNEYPAEEDYYVAGLEFVEAHGADLATSSLGYIDWYSQSDLDGQTAVTTQAVNIATENGVVCCTAAGNSGHDSDPGASHLLAPSDAFDVLACGAVDRAGNIADFSSDGPSADGRTKPELLALGVDTVAVWPYDTTGYVYVSGTSLSTPLVAGATALLVQAHPDWSVAQIRSHLLATASDYAVNGQPDPLSIRGYGILNVAAAHLFADCNANLVDDADDIASGTSQDANGDGVPDECECPTDLDGNGTTDLGDLSILLAGFGCASECAVDFNGDGATDLADLSQLLVEFGSDCPF